MQQADNLYELRKFMFEDLMKMGYKYIARDREGKIYAYSAKPTKQKKEEEWISARTDRYKDISLLSRIFTDIKWEDAEPFRIPYVNWDDVPVDTKVIVTGEDGSEWKCHFCKKLNDNAILVFRDGKTSWTTNDVVEVDIDRAMLA